MSAVLVLFGSALSSVTQAQCNYDDADLYNGWGWNSVTRTSCAPLTGELGQCEDRGGYPWGWNPVTLESCRLDVQTGAVVPATDALSAESITAGQVIHFA